MTHITNATLRRYTGRAKANLTTGTTTKITNHTKRTVLTVKCVELNALTPTGRNRKAFRILNATTY